MCYFTIRAIYLTRVFFPQFLIFQQNNSAQTTVLIFFTSQYYYFFEKSKIAEKKLCKLNCFYGKVSHTLNFKLQFKLYFEKETKSLYKKKTKCKK